MGPSAAPVCVIVGAGPGNGRACAARFAQAGYRVALLARGLTRVQALASTMDGARGYSCDVTDADSVTRAFAQVRAEWGNIDVLVYNPGPGVWGSVDEITPADFEASWRTNALGGLLAAREVIPAMKAKRSGAIVFIGATASRRGGPRTTAFAPAKAAQKSLAESLARYLWPQGIHVSLLLVDGVIDTAATRTMMPGKPNDFFLQPEHVAEAVHQLATQPRSAWAFELELRPFGEVW